VSRFGFVAIWHGGAAFVTRLTGRSNRIHARSATKLAGEILKKLKEQLNKAFR
jgi:hypothetical protein